MADATLQTDPETSEETFDYPVTLEDTGPATKKVRVEIPRERIEAKIEETIGELRSEAALPGFRKGKAPRHLVEKRFGKALRDQVQADLLRESYQHALEKHNLSPLGDPEFDDPENIKFPDEGDFSYTFTVEVQPEINLPTLEHLEVRKLKIEIKDEHVDQAMQNLREQQGHLMPVEDRGVKEKDYLIADVTVRDGDNVLASQEDAELVARPGRVAGIEVPDFADRVKGLKPGESRKFDVEVPGNHPDMNLAGKTLAVEVKLKDLKALELADIDEAFLESLGFADEKELREALREQMLERVENDVRSNMRRQVQDYLLSNTQLDLPAKLTAKQAERVVNRRAVDLMMQGASRDDVERNLQQLSQGAQEQAGRELKLFFILQKVAEERNIDVDEAELNGHVAYIAAQRSQRPETLKKQMREDGTLANLYIQLREHKTLDALIEQGKVKEVEPSEQEQKQAVGDAADIT